VTRAEAYRRAFESLAERVELHTGDDGNPWQRLPTDLNPWERLPIDLRAVRLDLARDLRRASDNGLAEPDARVAEVLQRIHENQEMIIEGFLAETGCLPSECELVQQTDGLVIRWHVQRRTERT